MEVYLHIFLTLATVGREQARLHAGRFISQEAR
jgi:hypothetical protein